MDKRQLRKSLRKALNESTEQGPFHWRYGTEGDRKLGHDCGNIVADMSDEIMYIIQFCLAEGMPEQDIRTRAQNAIDAGIHEYKRVNR